MKKNIIRLLIVYIYLILIYFSAALYAESNINTFSKIYAGNGDSWFNSVRQTSDNGYIAAGTKGKSGIQKSDIWIVKTDSRGKTIWEKTYNKLDWNKANDIYLTRDGDYIILGETINNEKSGRQVLIIKLDNNGGLLWEKSFNFSDDNEANTLIETEEGEFIIAGSLFYQAKKNSYLWILKIDNQGDVIWNKTFGGSTWDAANSISPTFDNGYIIGGVTEDEETGLKNIWIVKLNNKGDMVWDKVYEQYYWDAANAVQQTADSNFIVAGYTYSKETKKSSMWVLYLDNEGNKIWDKIYGGEDWDAANSLQQTSDGHFIIAGYTKSKGSGGKDIWIIKINEKGAIIWDRLYGYENDEETFSIRAASDGGYVAAGYTVSTEEEVKDAWLFKIDSKGNMPSASKINETEITYSPLWNKVYGSKNEEKIINSALTKDNGYILAGYSSSVNMKDKDGFIIKINKEGTQQWNKIYRYNKEDQINAIAPDNDGGYIAAGYTCSKENNKSDIWLFKINPSGDTIWSKTFGGPGEDRANSVCVTSDGKYVAAGFTRSLKNGTRDILVLKLDQKGEIIWQKTFGGEGDDEAISVLQTEDKGFIVAGNTSSKGEGLNDIWLIKLNSRGDVVWENTYGGRNYDGLSSIQITRRQGYIIAGYSRSEKGNSGILLLRLSKNGFIIWSKIYSRSAYDTAQSIIQTKDNNFIIGGTTFSAEAGGLDLWILRLDSDGRMIWNKTYGGAAGETANNIYQTSDNEFILIGSVSLMKKENNNFTIVKFQEKEGRNKLLILTDPGQCEIYLNDELKGLSPIELEGKTGEVNKLLIKKTNYHDLIAGLIINNTSNDKLFYSLEMKGGLLMIISHFPHVQLFIDDQGKKIIDQNKTVTVPILQGKHQLKFKNEFSGERIMPINMSINQTNLIMLDEDFFSAGSPGDNKKKDADKKQK